MKEGDFSSTSFRVLLETRSRMEEKHTKYQYHQQRHTLCKHIMQTSSNKKQGTEWFTRFFSLSQCLQSWPYDWITIVCLCESERDAERECKQRQKASLSAPAESPVTHLRMNSGRSPGPEAQQRGLEVERGELKGSIQRWRVAVLVGAGAHWRAQLTLHIQSAGRSCPYHTPRSRQHLIPAQCCSLLLPDWFLLLCVCVCVRALASNMLLMHFLRLSNHMCVWMRACVTEYVLYW